VLRWIQLCFRIFILGYEKLWRKNHQQSSEEKTRMWIRRWNNTQQEWKVYPGYCPPQRNRGWEPQFLLNIEDLGIRVTIPIKHQFCVFPTSMTKDLQATARQASSPTGVPTAFLEKGCTGKMPLAPRSSDTQHCHQQLRQGSGLTIFRDSAPPRRITSHPWDTTVPCRANRTEGFRRSQERHSAQAHLCEKYKEGKNKTGNKPVWRL